VTFALQMVDLWIAVLEGLATGLILIAFSRIAAPAPLQWTRRRITACWAIAAVLVLYIHPQASALPDGYEASAERSGMAILLTDEIQAVGHVNAAIADLQGRFVSLAHQLLVDDQPAGLGLCGNFRRLGVSRRGKSSLRFDCEIARQPRECHASFYVDD